MISGGQGSSDSLTQPLPERLLLATLISGPMAQTYCLKAANAICGLARRASSQAFCSGLPRVLMLRCCGKFVAIFCCEWWLITGSEESDMMDECIKRVTVY